MKRNKWLTQSPPWSLDSKKMAVVLIQYLRDNETEYSNKFDDENKLAKSLEMNHNQLVEALSGKYDFKLSEIRNIENLTGLELIKIDLHGYDFENSEIGKLFFND